jgi:hypothetical protein
VVVVHAEDRQVGGLRIIDDGAERGGNVPRDPFDVDLLSGSGGEQVVGVLQQDDGLLLRPIPGRQELRASDGGLRAVRIDVGVLEQAELDDRSQHAARDPGQGGSMTGSPFLVVMKRRVDQNARRPTRRQRVPLLAREWHFHFDRTGRGVAGSVARLDRDRVDATRPIPGTLGPEVDHIRPLSVTGAADHGSRRQIVKANSD